VNVPLRLRRRDAAATAADAFLFPAADAAAVARAADPAAVFVVAGGFLVVARGPTADRPPGAIRLRRLRGDLFVPIDADLLPALLPEEQTTLTRDAGLVVLPPGRVMAFDPARPLAPADWLRPPPVRRRAWEPFPPRPARPDRLVTVERPAPPAAVLEVLSAGAPPDAEPLGDAGPVPEDARPPSAGGLARVAAGAGMAAAGLLAFLGKLLRSPGLARRGADLARRAVERVPRLTEKLLGAQEAALREVLRQLQSGNVEDALRRAPVAVPDPAAPGRVDTGATLAPRDPRYSLRDLVSAGGPWVAWLGGGDVWAKLADEYRRLAAEAVRRGDYRRAAYLYGVLLRDVRSAAAVLLQGGLYRDAAVLYRDRLADLSAAARAFEQAGDVDEAVRLYLRSGQDETAADLLMRVGDTERAVELYTRAADRFVAEGRWVAAGDLLRTKAGLPAAAADVYRRGWEADAAEAVACGERLLDHLLVAEDWPAVDDLLASAERTFAPPRTADAGRFFTYARKVGDFLPPDRRADLADRVRLLFAAHIRAAAKPDQAARELFGPSASWPGPVARDAVYAARQTPRKPAGHPPPVPLADGISVGVAVARETGDVIVATTSAVVCWRPDAGRVEPVCPTGVRTVAGLATDPAGQRVIVMLEDGDAMLLRCFVQHHGRFTPDGQRSLARAESWSLWVSDTAGPGVPDVVVSSSEAEYWLASTNLREEEVRPATGRHPPYLTVDRPHGRWQWDDKFLRLLADDGRTVVRRWVPPWSPDVPAGSSLVTPVLDWATPAGRVLESVGVDRKGRLHWSEWDGRDGGASGEQRASLGHDEPFLAACLVAPGLVAAATAGGRVFWLRATGRGFAEWAPPTTLAVPARPVALVARPHAHEVAAILDDGSAVRLPRP
jgi:tetratricopeptide (TPR) repeat protein